MPILLPLGILAVIAVVLFGFSRILLSLTPTAATVTAIVVATGVVGTAARPARGARRAPVAGWWGGARRRRGDGGGTRWGRGEAGGDARCGEHRLRAHLADGPGGRGVHVAVPQRGREPPAQCPDLRRPGLRGDPAVQRCACHGGPADRLRR